MSIPKKGSREITVNGIKYRWTIRKKLSYGQAIGESKLTAAIELYESPGTTLLVKFPFDRPDSWIFSNNESVKPAMIREGIVQALNRGWEPESSTGTFEIEMTNKHDA